MSVVMLLFFLALALNEWVTQSLRVSVCVCVRVCACTCVFGRLQASCRSHGCLAPYEKEREKRERSHSQIHSPSENDSSDLQISSYTRTGVYF